MMSTEIGQKVWLFAKLQPGRARKRINATCRKLGGMEGYKTLRTEH